METRAVIFAALLALTPAAHAMDGGGWYNQWYEQWSKEEQRVEQRGAQVKRVEKTRCELKIEKYQKKRSDALVEDPDEERYLTRYYGWKLDNWIERCQAED